MKIYVWNPESKCRKLPSSFVYHGQSRKGRRKTVTRTSWNSTRLFPKTTLRLSRKRRQKPATRISWGSLDFSLKSYFWVCLVSESFIARAHLLRSLKQRASVYMIEKGKNKQALVISYWYDQRYYKILLSVWQGIIVCYRAIYTTNYYFRDILTGQAE